MANITKQTNIQLEKYLLNYRFINASSLKTGESINIGMVIEEYGKNPRIELINNIDIIEDLFPIFNLNHINFCKKAIEIKYKMKKIKKGKMKISQTICLSDSRLYSIDYNQKDNIDEILFNKYITLQRTQNILSSLIRKLSIIDIRHKLKCKNTVEIIDCEIITLPYINKIDNGMSVIKQRGI
jgi:hypothetical protein